MTHVFGCALVFFTGCVLLHWLLIRLTRGQAFVRNGYLFIVTASALAGVVIVPLGGLVTLVFYLFTIILWNLYITFFVNLMNSVSLRMMVEIDRAPGQTLSSADILNLYSDESALESRILEMTAGGLLRVAADQQLVLTRKGQLLARMLQLIRKIFGIEFFG